MSVAGLTAVAVIERDGVTVGAPPAGPPHHPVASSPDRGAGGCSPVHAEVVTVPVHRDVAPAETGAQPTGHGLREALRGYVGPGQARERGGQRGELGIAQRLPRVLGQGECRDHGREAGEEYLQRAHARLLPLTLAERGEELRVALRAGQAG